MAEADHDLSRSASSLERKALHYVRQSSAHQVLHNQRAVDRLAALGWSEIGVIDDDLGRSAAGAVHAPASSGW